MEFRLVKSSPFLSLFVHVYDGESLVVYVRILFSSWASRFTSILILIFPFFLCTRLVEIDNFFGSARKKKKRGKRSNMALWYRFDEYFLFKKKRRREGRKEWSDESKVDFSFIRSWNIPFSSCVTVMFLIYPFFKAIMTRNARSRARLKNKKKRRVTSGSPLSVWERLSPPAEMLIPMGMRIYGNITRWKWDERRTLLTFLHPAPILPLIITPEHHHHALEFLLLARLSIVYDPRIDIKKKKRKEEHPPRVSTFLFQTWPHCISLRIVGMFYWAISPT